MKFILLRLCEAKNESDDARAEVSCSASPDHVTVRRSIRAVPKIYRPVSPIIADTPFAAVLRDRMETTA
jgi:hypothetical protein